MAVRVEFFALPAGKHLENMEDGLVSSDARRLGYVSASDSDEQLLFDVLGLVGERSGLLDARGQGDGLVPAAELGAVGSVLEAITDSDLDALDRGHGPPARVWLDTLISSLSAAQSLSLPLAWRTRYDRGGSTDDGPDEFPTAWSGASPP